MRRCAFVVPLKNSKIEESFVKGKRFSVSQLLPKNRGYRFWSIGKELDTPEKVFRLAPPLGAGGFSSFDNYCISDDDFRLGYTALEFEFGDDADSFEARFLKLFRRLSDEIPSGGNYVKLDINTLGMNLFALDGVITEKIFCQEHYTKTGNACYYIKLKLDTNTLKTNYVIYDNETSSMVSNNSVGSYIVHGSDSLTEEQYRKFYNNIYRKGDLLKVIRSHYADRVLKKSTQDALIEVMSYIASYQDVIMLNQKCNGLLEKLTDEVLLKDEDSFDVIIGKFTIVFAETFKGREWW